MAGKTFGNLMVLVLCALARLANAQVSDDAMPLSKTAGLKLPPVFVNLNIMPGARMAMDTHNSEVSATGKKAFYFAERHDVDLSPQNSGTWENIRQEKVWRLGIRASGSYSVYLTFYSLNLSPGVRLYVYSPSYKQLTTGGGGHGADNAMSTPPISGDSVIVEMDVPGDVQNFGTFRLVKAYLDLLGVFKQTSLAQGSVNNDSSSRPCDQNINCENGTYWQTEKRAVCKIITDGALSTGALIGNTSRDKKPYLITAYHTMFDRQHAAESVFIFNYECNCNGNFSGDIQALSGADSVAATPGLDYALLKLSTPPPAAFQPFYAGWDIRETAPLRGICIHHPEGRYKQIAISNHPLTPDAYAQGYLANSSWKVADWDLGYTEPGSSGAPLFDQRHHLVGTLTGGYSSCANAGSDFFNKLSISWDRSAGSGIKAALDGAGTGEYQIDGYDPYGISMEDCDTISNISHADKTELSAAGAQWGYLTGQNSLGFTAFAEKFTSAASLLIPGFYMQVAKCSYADATSHITVKIWRGTDIPQKEIYSRTVLLKALKTGFANYIQLDSAVQVGGTFFVGYAISYSNPRDTFAVYHAANRGGKSPSSMYVFNGAWNNSRVFNYATSLGIALTECYGRSFALHRDEITLYPNPGVGYTNINIPNGLVIDGVECFDMTGRQHPVSFQASELANRILFNLSPGVYIISIKSSGKRYSSKLLVQGQ